MTELAEINRNPLNPGSFVKTWEIFDPQVLPTGMKSSMLRQRVRYVRYVRRSVSVLLSCPDRAAASHLPRRACRGGSCVAGNWIHIGVSIRAVRAKSTWVAYPCPYDATVAKATKAAYTASTAAGVRFRALLA
jgi:hypothetical protein